MNRTRGFADWVIVDVREQKGGIRDMARLLIEQLSGNIPQEKEHKRRGLGRIG